MKQMFFWNPLAFSMIQGMLAIWCLVPAFSRSSVYIWRYMVHVLAWSRFSLAWRILSITLLACEKSTTARVVWTSSDLTQRKDLNGENVDTEKGNYLIGYRLAQLAVCDCLLAFFFFGGWGERVWACPCSIWDLSLPNSVGPVVQSADS